MQANKGNRAHKAYNTKLKRHTKQAKYYPNNKSKIIKHIQATYNIKETVADSPVETAAYMNYINFTILPIAF